MRSINIHKNGKTAAAAHIYMLGLVPSDIVVLAVNITISVTILKGGLWMNDGICSLQAHVMACASSITTAIHTAMSIDRWVSILFPHTEIPRPSGLQI